MLGINVNPRVRIFVKVCTNDVDPLCVEIKDPRLSKIIETTNGVSLEKRIHVVALERRHVCKIKEKTTLLSTADLEQIDGEIDTTKFTEGCEDLITLPPLGAA